MGARPPASGPPPPPKPQPLRRGNPKKEIEREDLSTQFPPWVIYTYVLLVAVLSVAATVIFLLID